MSAEPIVRALGQVYRSGIWRRCCCPVHGGDRASLALRDGDRGLAVHCHRGCSAAEIYAELRRQGLLGDGEGALLDESEIVQRRRQAERADRRRRIAAGLDIWSQTYGDRSNLAERYLRLRGYTGPIPSTIRAHGLIRHTESGEQRPAMVGLVEHVEHGRVGVHDLDVTGFSIFGTLGTSTCRYVFENEVPIVDIGLRLADVEAMELESEPVLVRGEWADRAATLKRHAATPEEIQFLRYRRVELNAMTSEQLVEFIEEKLGEYGVKNVVPDADTIERHARRLIEQRLANQALERMLEQIGKQAALATLPADLTQQTLEKLREEAELSWDAAVLEVVQELKLDDEL